MLKAICLILRCNQNATCGEMSLKTNIDKAKESSLQIVALPKQQMYHALLCRQKVDCMAQPATLPS